MSIADNISRINNAKISMIEAIQSNIDIDLPSGLRIHELAPYITSACQVRYQAGVIAGGGSSSSSSESGGVSFPSTVYVTGSFSVAGIYTQTGSHETVNGINYPVYSNGSFYYIFEYDRWKFFSSYPVSGGPYYQADSATTEMVTTYTDGPMSEGSPYPVVSLTPASNTYPDALIVSNAMTSECNGVYYNSNETIDNKPIYVNNQSAVLATKIIIYLEGYWRIFELEEDYEYYYGSSLIGSYSQGTHGAGPGCTVAEYSGGESFPSVVYVTNTPGTSSVAGTYNQTEYSTTVASVNYPVYSNGSFYLVFESNKWKIFSSYPAESGPYYEQVSEGTDITSEYTDGPMGGGTPYPVVSLTPASNAYPDALIVSDAMTSNCNGVYNKTSDERQGKPIYRQPNSPFYIIAYDYGYWYIADSTSMIGDGNSYYYGSSLTGSYSQGNYGAGPGCTVAEYSGQSQGTITATNCTINGTAYVSIGTVSLQASASNGATCTFTGSLPNGLSMTSAGVITGTCTSAVNDTYSITVSADGCASTTLTLTVQISLGTINITGSPEISGTVGSEISSVNLTSYASASNGQSCTFDGNMPSGLTLSSGGTISGTPTNGVNSTYQITVSANGCTSNTISVSISIEEQQSGSSSSSSGGGNNNPCVLKGTKIALSDGTEKNVEDITYDDSLLVWDFDNAVFASAKPAWILHGGNTKHCWKTEFSNGTSLYVTGPEDLGRSHRALSIDDGEFIYFQDIVGKDVATMNQPTKITSCEKESCDTDYFNIITEHHLNCFANGILTSCRLSNLAKIENMKYVEHSESDIDYSDIPEYYVRTLRLKEQKTDMHDYMNSNIIPLALPRKVESPCFLRGTKLTLADGTTKNIEDLTYEDELLTWDFDEGKPSAQKPVWIYKGYTNYYGVVEFSNGIILRVTGDSNGNTHRLYDVVNGSFNYVNTLLGHEVITENGGKVTVDSYEIVDENVNEEYYNIITEHDYNYYINGILASCSLNNKLYSVDESMKYVKRESKSISHPALDGVVSEKDYEALRVGELPTSVDDYIISVVNSKFHK